MSKMEAIKRDYMLRCWTGRSQEILAVTVHHWLASSDFKVPSFVYNPLHHDLKIKHCKRFILWRAWIWSMNLIPICVWSWFDFLWTNFVVWKGWARSFVHILVCPNIIVSHTFNCNIMWCFLTNFQLYCTIFQIIYLIFT